jgi:hypothetical protein
MTFVAAAENLLPLQATDSKDVFRLSKGTSLARRARREFLMFYWRAVVLAGALAALTPAATIAAPVACSPGTLSDYVALTDGCTVGAFLFDNFTEGATLQTGATRISPDAVQVTPIAAGLAFGVDVAAGPTDLLELIFGYDVSHPAIGGASLSTSGASATGDAAVTAVKNLCEGASFNPPGSVDGCTGVEDALIAFAIEGLSDLDESVDILPFVKLLGVVDDITVDGGLAGTGALTGSVTNQFAAVPEPSSSLLVATGIFGILRARYARSRRRRRLRTP